MTSEDNGNIGWHKPTSSSNEDLSEYTDADESISAPTEFLAEFLSAVMSKDYVTALKYCNLILQYEPNNATAQEFYPLIMEKLQQTNGSEDSSSNDSEEEDNSVDNCSSSSSESGSSSSSSSEDSSEVQEEEEEEEELEVGRGDKQSKGSSDGDATTGSYSSLEDDEAETDQLAALAAKHQIDNVNLGNGNKILSWWTTSITEYRHVQTVWLLERRRLRAHQRLTNHTHTVTIAEGTVVETTQPENTPVVAETVVKPPEATTSSTSHTEERSEEDDRTSIVERMDSDTCVLRQRRLAFYNRNGEAGSSDSFTVNHTFMEHNYAEAACSFHSESNFDRQSTEELRDASDTRINEITDPSDNFTVNNTLMGYNYAEAASSSQSSDSNFDTQSMEERRDANDIRIKLKYINDDLKLVDGKLQEQLGDFKKRHFQGELSSNKLVRLIFNGQVLQQDSKTLQGCGLFDNCVVHCLIHQRRSTPGEENSESRNEPLQSTQNRNTNQNNNNNQGREWDLGSILFIIISFALLSAWYFRYVYAHLYTVTATVGLILLTGVFTIVLFGFYFPDHEHLPRMENTQGTQSQT